MDSSEKFLKPQAVRPRRETLKGNQEWTGTGRRTLYVAGAKAGHGVLNR